MMSGPLSGGGVSNQQLYEALMDIQQSIADVRVQIASQPCREHAYALDAHDNRIAAAIAGYREADRELKAEISRKQIVWTGGGAAGVLAAIAAWLGVKGGA